ncbi:amidase [Rhizobium mayense]|uniref:Indoleacetamide hydrolase n=1 Tax=Rhizobium mayense TaxID=1312184 RepID=A0ABT7K7A2_9HYPH|nr:amidase [Rhizobium mayense]MDL2403298.1 amidase [Rhizobium mayense]
MSHELPPFRAGDTIERLARARSEGLITSSGLVERSLAHAAELRTRGSVAFTRLWPEDAKAAAGREDRLSASGTPSPSPLAGLPIAVKDNCDVRGDITQAGSEALAIALPAARDADCVARLRTAGAVIIGKANMSEFAFTNTGENRHFGTPLNPVDPLRLVGGSSSGSAACVADGSAIAALGTDTGGSIRGPAALCGLAGFKPSEGRISTRGVVSLSETFDTIGPIARSIKCCAIIDSALADEQWRPLAQTPLLGMVFGVPTTVVLDELDPQVADAFSGALESLSREGATIIEFSWPELGEAQWREAYPVISHTEVYASHGRLVEGRGHFMEPSVVDIILSGKPISMRERREALNVREAYVLNAHERISRFHAVLMPTVPILPPLVAMLKNPDEHRRVEFMIGRNNEIANFFDCCAATVPCQKAGDLPVGLLVQGKHGDDRRLLSIAHSVEACVSDPALRHARFASDGSAASER